MYYKRIPFDIQAYLDNRGVKRSYFEKKLGVSTATISEWKAKSSVPEHWVKKIAQFDEAYTGYSSMLHKNAKKMVETLVELSNEQN